MAITRIFDILPLLKTNYQKKKLFSKKRNGQWETFSTNEFVTSCHQISLGLAEIGIKKDDKIAIVSYNRFEWTAIDFGVQQLGAVSVPIYPTLTPEDIRYIFQNSETKIVFVETQELYDKVQVAIKDLPNIEAVYTLETIGGATHWSELLALGKDKEERSLDVYRSQVTEDDVLTIIYTSGTTGTPKGVMLSHKNLVSNVLAATPLLPIDSTTNVLSFLPMCHVFERMLVFLYLHAGVSIDFAESIESIGNDLKESKPYFFTCVPRLLEKVYDKIYAKGLELTGFKKVLFFWSLELGDQFIVGKDMGLWYNIKLSIARKLVFSKWKAALGGNVRAIVTGSAALQPRLARVFWAAGIHILEGYGLTETSPVISVNRYEAKDNRIGTVGPVLEGVEVKLSASGEILTRGPHIMKGYYKNPEATAQAIDAEGWFNTGDIGSWEEDRFLKITGRVKEIFKTSGGKYVSPQALETKFVESVLIEQIMIVGENQKFPGALIVPSFSNLKDYCDYKGYGYTTDAEMVEHPEVIEKFQREIDKYNESFARYEQVKRFKLLPRLWSIEEGELTPTMKCKRKVILVKYKKEIDWIYDC